MVGSPRNEATILAFLHDTPPQIQVTSQSRLNLVTKRRPGHRLFLITECISARLRMRINFSL